MIESAKKDDRQTPAAEPLGAAVYALAALVIVLIGMVVFGMLSGRFNSTFARLRVLQQVSQKFNSGGYEYYMVVPNRPVPNGGCAGCRSLSRYRRTGEAT